MSTAIEFQNVEILQSNIIFKQINREDFQENGYEVIKSDIVPTSEGYISEQIKDAINFEEKNTVVINAGVGQGKTFTVMQIAHRYHQEGFVLVFAVPYKSLIDQYKGELKDLEIPPELIFDYRDLEENGEDVDGEEDSENSKIVPEEAAGHPIHLLTINCILGNPGEDFLEQSKAKSDYLSHLVRRCNSERKQVVLILDEIHDGIHNFQQKFIFNLWRWKPVIHKILSVSATYNEAAKIVIKYLAELTDNKIHIIESARAKIEDKQSDLYLLLYNKNHYNPEDEDLISVFDYLLTRDKRINILSYSKTIAEGLADTSKSVGEMLGKKYGKENVNLCTGDSGNIFDPNKCNIGTTFSTGINIRGSESAFVVLLPSNYSIQQRKTGIFSRGINILIQALARIRDKSEIYIIMPAPEYLIPFTNEHNLTYTNKVRQLPFFSFHPIKQRYYDINEQKSLINQTYQQIREPLESVIAEIEHIKEERTRASKPSLYYPTLEDYVLSSGEQVLYSKYDIFGKNLSVYSMWAAFNDQFLNCRLKGIAVLNVLTLERGRILQTFREFAYRNFFDFVPFNQTIAGISDYFNFHSDKECYQAFRSVVFKNSIYYIDSTSTGEITSKLIGSYKSPKVERKVLAIVQLLKKPHSGYNRKFYNSTETTGYTGNFLFNMDGIKENESFSDTDYLLACFSHSQRTDIPEDISEDEKTLIRHYKFLSDFLLCFKESLIKNDGVKNYFENNIGFSDCLTESYFQSVYESIQYIRVNDPIVKNKVVSFLQKLPLMQSSNRLEILAQVYRVFRRLFFDTAIERVDIAGDNNRRYVIKSMAEIPHPSEIINLLFSPKDAWFENPVSMDGTSEITYTPGHPEAE